MSTPIYNFSAGPATLPEDVLKQAQAELLDYQGTGFSVMTMSHRSDLFMDIMQRAENSLRQLMNIPNNYKVLFLQGGASAQFNMLSLNLAQGFKTINSVVTGNWSLMANNEMGKLVDAKIHVAAHAGELYNYNNLPSPSAWQLDESAAYTHYTSNETVHGLQYQALPTAALTNTPLVCDMSSDIISRPVNVNDFGVIYAGAQKNIGPAGTTIVIIREDLLERSSPLVPSVWNYKSHVDKEGMYNTPATYPVYIAGLVFDWLIQQGGVSAIEAKNNEKAAQLYAYIDSSDGYYKNTIDAAVRSKMNVIFHTASAERDAQFAKEADQAGLKLLKGYKSMGGMRASIYNAMPLAGVEALIKFMDEFKARNA
ncbi:MAG: 3-phosphoserine/phosphohydroxythreonine transaminase [Neisseriaceae bacterium]|nr:3-phosphoserine/phosphohydroxythreonine transaminase [Neisseriaceae bacterium]